MPKRVKSIPRVYTENPTSQNSKTLTPKSNSKVPSSQKSEFYQGNRNRDQKTKLSINNILGTEVLVS